MARVVSSSAFRLRESSQAPIKKFPRNEHFGIAAAKSQRTFAGIFPDAPSRNAK